MLDIIFCVKLYFVIFNNRSIIYTYKYTINVQAIVNNKQSIGWDLWINQSILAKRNWKYFNWSKTETRDKYFTINRMKI